VEWKGKKGKFTEKGGDNAPIKLRVRGPSFIYDKGEEKTGSVSFAWEKKERGVY